MYDLEEFCSMCHKDILISWLTHFVALPYNREARLSVVGNGAVRKVPSHIWMKGLKSILVSTTNSWGIFNQVKKLYFQWIQFLPHKTSVSLWLCYSRKKFRKSKDLLNPWPSYTWWFKTGPPPPHPILSPSVQLPTVWKNFFFQNQPKICRVISLQQPSARHNKTCHRYPTPLLFFCILLLFEFKLRFQVKIVWFAWYPKIKVIRIWLKENLLRKPFVRVYEHFPFFSLSFFSLCNLQQEKDSPHENAKKFCFVFLLSVEVFLEADASEFWFGTFSSFSLSLFLSV